MMECKNCCYFWQEEGEKYPRCYFEDWVGEPDWLNIPPCEEDDDLELEEEELEDWELAGYSSEEDYIEDMRAQMWVDAWKNGDRR